MIAAMILHNWVKLDHNIIYLLLKAKLREKAMMYTKFFGSAYFSSNYEQNILFGMIN